MTLADDRVAGDVFTATTPAPRSPTSTWAPRKPVNVTGISISGTDAGNYSLTSTTATATANITPATVTGSVAASDKVYDGTTAATITTRSLTGALGTDDVSLSGGTARLCRQERGQWQDGDGDRSDPGRRRRRQLRPELHVGQHHGLDHLGPGDAARHGRQQGLRRHHRRHDRDRDPDRRRDRRRREPDGTPPRPSTTRTSAPARRSPSPASRSPAPTPATTSSPPPPPRPRPTSRRSRWPEASRLRTRSTTARPGDHR